MDDFVSTLTTRLHASEGNTSELPTADAAKMLSHQHRPHLPRVTLQRTVCPEDLITWFILEIEDNVLVLTPDQLIALRGVLAAWDGGTEPRYGDPLITPAKLPGGRTTHHYEPAVKTSYHKRRLNQNREENER